MTYLTSVAGAAPTLRYDEPSGEMVATFAKEYAGLDADGKATSCVVDHEAWWVDSRGVAARMPLVTEYGAGRRGRLAPRWGGPGLVGRHAGVRRGDAVRAPPPIVTPAVTTLVEARPSTLAPKRGKKVTVRVQVTPSKKSVTVRRQMLVKGKWKTMSTKRTTSQGSGDLHVHVAEDEDLADLPDHDQEEGRTACRAVREFTITTR